MSIAERFMLSMFRNYYLPYLNDIAEGSSIGKILLYSMRFVKSGNIEGDYLEFGVHKGRSLITAYRLSTRYNLSMKFYAFDSFGGLPAITGVDAQGFSEFSPGEYSCSIKNFRKNLVRGGVDLMRVSLIPGWYDQTLKKETKKNLSLKKASIILVDCDLYESTVPVMNFITDYIQEGTIIIFDDWFSFRGNPHRGEQRAFREWLEKNPSFQAVEFYKAGNINSFIMHNREDTKEKRSRFTVRS